MYDTHASTSRMATTDGFRIAAPRAGDMLTGALRTAYGSAHRLPADMLALITQLDRVDMPDAGA